MENELHDKRIREKAIDELTKKFRVAYEEMKAIDMEDCINWADWLVVEAEMMKGGAEC